MAKRRFPAHNPVVSVGMSEPTNRQTDSRFAKTRGARRQWWYFEVLKRTERPFSMAEYQRVIRGIHEGQEQAECDGCVPVEE